MCAQSFRRVWLFETPWTVARQVPLSMGFSRHEYWNGLPCPPPGDLPNPGMESKSFHLLQWQASSLPLSPPGKPSQGAIRFIKENTMKKTLKNNRGNSINPMRLQSHEGKQHEMFLYFQPCKEKWVGTSTHPFNQHLLSSYNLPGSAPDAGDSPSSESIKVCVGCTSLENY